MKLSRFSDFYDFQYVSTAAVDLTKKGGFQTITIDSNGVSVVPQVVGNTPDPGYVASGQATVSPNNRLMARGTVIGNKKYVKEI